MDTAFFPSPLDFRAWLEANHETAGELWVGFYKKSTGEPSITWPQSVDEALCFGWIDGIRKSIDDRSYTIRFTPRKEGSTWSNVNVKRVQELSALGLMTPAGLAAFARRVEARTGEYSYENRGRFDAELEAEFRANETAWSFFEAQPPGYRRNAAWWVMSAKREETRRKHLAALMKDSEEGRRLVAVTGPARSK